MAKQTDHTLDIPRENDTDITYAKRLQSEGQREIYIRKALREHFAMDIAEVITACAPLTKARALELNILRTRFPDLSENRFAWKIAQTLTISKDEARSWAKKIVAAEGTE